MAENALDFNIDFKLVSLLQLNDCQTIGKVNEEVVAYLKSKEFPNLQDLQLVFDNKDLEREIKFQDLYEYVHKILLLPRTRKFLQELYHIEKLTLNLPNQKEKTPKKSPVTIESSQESNLWREIQNTQNLQVLNQRKQQSNNEESFDGSEFVKVSLKSDSSPSFDSLELLDNPTVPTREIKHEPVPTLSEFKRSAPISISEGRKIQTDSFVPGSLKDSLMAKNMASFSSFSKSPLADPITIKSSSFGNSNLLELGPRKSLDFELSNSTRKSEFELSARKSLEFDIGVRKSTELEQIDEVEKSVPYLNHQIVFPSSFFASYSISDQQRNALLSNHLIHDNHPLQNSEFFSTIKFSISESEKLDDRISNTAHLSLQNLIVCYNSNGSYDLLLEAVICQQMYNIFHNLYGNSINKSEIVKKKNDNLRSKFDYFVSSTNYHIITKKFSTLTKNLREQIWTEERYLQYLERFIFFRNDESNLKSLMDQLYSDLLASLNANALTSLNRIERMLICLLGHKEPFIRNKATIFLHVLYDKHNWQEDQSFWPKIRCIGDCFSHQINYSQIQDYKNADLVVVVSIPTGNKHRYQKFYTRPIRAANSLIIELFRFNRAGYYDWKLGYFDETGTIIKPIKNDEIQSQGRFIVHPKFRNEVIHEVFVDIEGAVWDKNYGGPVQQRGTFSNIEKSLAEYQNYNITTLYVMGSLERAEFGMGSPFSPIDRSTPNRKSGGAEQFEQLLISAKGKKMKVLVDATPRVSIKGEHRKYRGLQCKQLDVEGMPICCLGTDGAEHVWKESAHMNYRKKQCWDLFIEDILNWAKKGVSGIRIDSAHCFPLISKANHTEMERMDNDGKFHYTLQEIFDSEFVISSSDDAHSFGYFGTQAYKDGYPNPLFIKATSSIWNEHPDFIFCGEVYWGREKNAITSGLIPYSTGIQRALSSVFGVGVNKDGVLARLDQRCNVKAFYDWYERERTTYPENSIIVYPSSNHYSPYPASIYGYGTWSTVDLLYFLPEVPSTYVGEHNGWSMKYDHLSNSFIRQTIGHYLNFSQFSEISGHYHHRSKMRKTNSLLSSGGMILLYAKISDKEWHDRVFSFARFEKDHMAIIAINFNDVDSYFYIDFTPLKEIFNEESCIYERQDLINPFTTPVYFSLKELLNERQSVQLAPYASLCWSISKVTTSPGVERVLFEHSLNRLQRNLAAGMDPNSNLVYSLLQGALEDESPNCLQKLDEEIKLLLGKLPHSAVSDFPKLLQRALRWFGVSKKKESRILAILEVLKDTKGPSRQLSNRNIYELILEKNILGPIVFVTPEIGRFSKIGGIAVMVDELTQAMISLGCEIIVISPYYNFNSKGKTGYLKEEGVEWLQNIVTFVGNERIEVGVHYYQENGIKYYFIHHFDFFPTPYHAGSTVHQLKTIVLMAKSSLELLCQLQILPAVIVSNDWYTGLIPAYGLKSGAFGTTFNGTTFFHLIHNLEEGYEGKIYLDGDDLGYVHHLPRQIVIDPNSNQLCINASRAALMCCNQWGTVSTSYRADLMGGVNPSPLRYYLCQFPQPFAHSNGIRVKERLELLTKIASDHLEAKKKLQLKYFGTENLDIPLFSFVGRICLQKGVHLILNSVRELIDRYSGRIQIMVCGAANYKDAYAAQCAWSMQALRSAHPNNFWADPTEFFTDVPLLNMGSDFALVPSLFEPSGVVQQEYFAAATPVIAFKTGGLKDTVFEGIDGNGFTFEDHKHKDFVDAISRAIACYLTPKRYLELRERAKKATLDMLVVAEAWAKEFSRLRQCMWADKEEVKKIKFTLLESLEEKEVVNIV